MNLKILRKSTSHSHWCLILPVIMTHTPPPPVPVNKPKEGEGEGGREKSAKGCINLKASFGLVLYQPQNLNNTPKLDGNPNFKEKLSHLQKKQICTKTTIQEKSQISGNKSDIFLKYLLTGRNLSVF